MTGIGVRNGAPSVQAEAHTAAVQAAQRQEGAKVSSLLRSLHRCARTCALRTTLCSLPSSPSPAAEHVARHGLLASWLVSQQVLHLGPCSRAAFSDGMRPTKLAERTSPALKHRPSACLSGGTRSPKGHSRQMPALVLRRLLNRERQCSATFVYSRHW